MSNNLLIFILITILFLDLYDQMTYDKNINIKPVMYSMNNELNNNNIKFKSTDKFNNIDYTNTNQYINNLLLVLFIIIKYQKNDGTSIIKLDGIFYKIIIDVILILSSIYDKVFLTKPNISNITKGDRYIICKKIKNEAIINSNLLSQIEKHLTQKLLNPVSDKNLHSILNNEIPYYFLNKIEETNAIIGQQQLESLDQIINIFKNKNKIDKIESLKRNHIQKCVNWCEKNQIPHNKFIDKINIFLSPKKHNVHEHESESEPEP
jgi:hypothetical protein